MTEAAARTLLARLKGRGSLTVARAGRVGVYQLAGGMPADFERIGRGPQQAPWDGKFRTIVFDISESERALKDRLRYLSNALGYGSLLPGVLINPQDHSETLLELQQQSPPGGLPAQGLPEFDPVSSRAVADRAWDLPRRAAAFAARYAAIERLLSAGRIPAPGLSAFRSWYHHYLATVKVRLADPDFPAELLPAGWSAVPLAAALDSLGDEWDAAVLSHVEAVFAASTHGDLVIRREPAGGVRGP